MYDKKDFIFDVAAALEQLRQVAAPRAPEYVEGARLVFDVCGWAYLVAYARHYGDGGTARRMAENAANAAADFQRWLAGAANVAGPTGDAPEAASAAAPETPFTFCRKGEAGENGAC